MIKKNYYFLWLLVGSFLLFNGCNQPSSQPAKTSVDLTLALSRSQLYLQPNIDRSSQEVIQITRGADIALPLTISSYNQDIMDVTLSSDSRNFTITALQEGQDSITVTDANGITSTTLTVIIDQRDLTLELSPTSANIKVNGNASISITKGADVGTLTATSDNPSIATATLSGNSLTVTGVSAGTTAINVSDGNINAIADITVASLDFSLSLSQGSAGVKVNQIISIDINKGADIGTLTATSSSSAVARVAISGNTLTVTGVTQGSATITVTDGNASITADITVSNLDLALTVSTSSAQMKVNERISIDLSKGRDIGTLNATTSDSSVANASLSGSTLTVTALSAGNATITVTDGNISAMVAITVIPLDLSLSVSPSDVNMKIDEKFTVEVIKGADVGDYKTYSTDESVVRVERDGDRLILIGINKGDAKIVVTDGNTESIVYVSVSSFDNTLSLSPTDINMKVDEKFIIEVTKGADVGDYKAYSTDESVVKVERNGERLILIGINKGNAKIVVTDGNTEVVAYVSVSALDNALSLSMTTASMKVNSTLGVEIFKGVDVGDLKVTSSNTAIAKAYIDGNKLVVTSGEKGDATLTITNGAIKASIIITVKPLDLTLVLLPTSIKVEPTKTTMVTITKGLDVGILTATSSNTSVARVSLSGNTLTVTGVAKGSATITITDGTTSKTLAVNVVDLSLKISPKQKTISAGSSEDLEINKGLDVGALIVTSSNPTIATATVSGNKLSVRGVTAGNATITVTDGQVSDTASITVSK